MFDQYGIRHEIECKTRNGFVFLALYENLREMTGRNHILISFKYAECRKLCDFEKIRYFSNEFAVFFNPPHCN